MTVFEQKFFMIQYLDLLPFSV